MTDLNQSQATAFQGRMQLSELLVDFVDISPAQDKLVRELQLNSQRVVAGDIFIALPGLTADGRDYIDHAIEKGAVAVLFESGGASQNLLSSTASELFAIEGLKQKLGAIANKYYGQPSAAMTIVGITGTNGKTTLAYLLAQSLQLLGKHCGYSGTIGSGELNNLVKTPLTTPDAISIHAQLSKMLDMEMDAVCMEVSSHSLDQGRVNGVQFDLAVFTNLTQDHLDYHQSMAQYARAKRRLFEIDGLPKAAINIDDDYGQALLQFCREKKPRLQCISFGTSKADIQPQNLEVNDKGILFQINANGTKYDFHSSLLGLINLSNLLATIACLNALDYGYADIARVIGEISPPPGRMEAFRNQPDQPIVVIDYAHTPDALKRALQSLKPLCRGRLVVIFGCGGDRDQGKRPLMGKVAEQLADRIILTDDNPRTESPKRIIAQIQCGISMDVEIVHDRREATARAISESSSGDIILLAGKGHEETQTMGDQVIALSDRKFVVALLQELT